MQIFGQNSPQVTTEAVVTKLSDAPVMVDTTDNDSTATEVSRGTDSVENVPTPSGSPTAVQPFKLAIPEPLEKASQTALIAVQLWWDQMMPLLQKLQAQILLQLDPYVKASAERFAQLQAEIAPHTEPARKLLTEWNAKLEPHAKAAMESVETARQAVMAKAYEPALVAIQQASVAVQKHAETTAALVSSKAAVGFEASKEWLEVQKPLLLKARETAMAHAANLLAALLEWKKQIEPIVVEQLQLAQKRTIEMSLAAGVAIQEHSKTAHAQLLVHAEKAKVAAAPHVEMAKVWADEQSKKAMVHIEPHLKPVQAWAEETNTKLAPAMEPLGKFLQDGWGVLSVWLLQMAKQLEPAGKQIQKWSMETLECMCLPIQQSLLDYKAAKAAEGEAYPPPVYAEPKTATVVD